uniref:Uncharacterized protein n=1 Tax=Branchiostoma floridae TaxID=7739 RepID=C3ZGW8_BRAFL|eukprot:XP_002592104.1 hypothetical protein BRAFLDRAFT_84973 [Branchiostoma floridae]
MGASSAELKEVAFFCQRARGSWERACRETNGLATRRKAQSWPTVHYLKDNDRKRHWTVRAKFSVSHEGQIILEILCFGLYLTGVKPDELCMYVWSGWGPSGAATVNMRTLMEVIRRAGTWSTTDPPHRGRNQQQTNRRQHLERGEIWRRVFPWVSEIVRVQVGDYCYGQKRDESSEREELGGGAEVSAL